MEKENKNDELPNYRKDFEINITAEEERNIALNLLKKGMFNEDSYKAAIIALKIEKMTKAAGESNTIKDQELKYFTELIEEYTMLEKKHIAFLNKIMDKLGISIS